MRRFLPLPYAQISIFATLLAIFLVHSDASAQIRTDPCEAYLSLLRNSPPSDQKAGSILFFAKYTSDTVDPQREDTQINITNTNVEADVDVHLYLVDGSTCAVSDSRVTLSPNQTSSFLASDLDPGIVGYIVAIANYEGVPTWFNYLIGDAYYHELDGQVGMLPAMAISRVSHDDVRVKPNETADLVFDGNEYERLPRVVALSSYLSQVTHNTTLALFVPTQNLIFGGNSASTIVALLYDDTERVRSASFIARCYRRVPLLDLRVPEGLNNFVKAGHTGWIKVMTAAEQPLLGAAFTRGPQFNGALNLRHLSLLNTFTITVPVI